MFEESILSRLPEEKFKIVIVGETGVGKTTLFKRFIQEEDTTQNGTSLTQTIDFRIKSYQIKKRPVKFYIWDTAGQEKYRSIVSAYFQGCQAVIIVFDLNNPESYDHAIGTWLPLVIDKTAKAVIMLVGNKSDLENRIAADIKTVAKEKDILYRETAALHDKNVRETFEEIAIEIQQRVTIGFKQLQQEIAIDPEKDYRAQAESIQNTRTSRKLSDKKIDLNKPNKCQC